MRISIIAVGKLKDKYLQAGIETYLKRIKKYSKIELVRIKEEPKPNRSSELKAIEKEGEKIISTLKRGDTLIALTEEGTTFTSPQFAQKLIALRDQTPGRLVFAIGSGPGLSPSVKRRADLLLSLSKLTFPHQLALLLLLEQIYRALTINEGEPYHR